MAVSHEEGTRYQRNPAVLQDFDAGVGELKEKKKHQKSYLMARRTEEEKLEVLTSKESTWWLFYVNNPLLEEEKYYQDKFRHRFRLPYNKYVELVNDCKADNHFAR